MRHPVRVALFGVATLHLVLAPACGKASDTAPPETPEGAWRDSSCGLAWQQDSGPTLLWTDAVAYCEGLDLAGLVWRLPTIGELRCLVDGCQETALDGDCEVTDECTGTGCLTTACDGCGDAETIDCYWSSQLGAGCDDPLWSASTMDEESAWLLHFRDGSISHDELTEGHLVRCVSED